MKPPPEPPHESARPNGSPTGANENRDIIAASQTGSSLLVDRQKAAIVLGVSAGTIDNLRLRGQLPSLKVAARRLYDLRDLHRFIEARKESRDA